MTKEELIKRLSSLENQISKIQEEIYFLTTTLKNEDYIDKFENINPNKKGYRSIRTKIK